MSISDAQSSHRPQLVRTRLTSHAEGGIDHVPLTTLVEQQRIRIEQLEAILEPLSTAESWALAWAREHEPWNQIRRVLNQLP